MYLEKGVVATGKRDYDSGPACTAAEHGSHARRHLRSAQALLASASWQDARHHAHAAAENALKAHLARQPHRVPRLHDLRELYRQTKGKGEPFAAAEAAIERLARDHPSNVGQCGCETHVESSYNPTCAYYTGELAQQSVDDAEEVLGCAVWASHSGREEVSACWERMIPDED